MRPKRFPTLAVLLAAATLCAAAYVAKEKPPVETAYTQDGANCVRGRVRDQENRPIEGARVTLVEEKSLTGIAATQTDKKGEFAFRSVPFRQELLLMVEADGFSKATVPDIKVVPPYSCVATVRLRKVSAAEPAK
jgi:hypothetical protein